MGETEIKGGGAELDVLTIFRANATTEEEDLQFCQLESLPRLIVHYSLAVNYEYAEGETSVQVDWMSRKIVASPSYDLSKRVIFLCTWYACLSDQRGVEGQHKERQPADDECDQHDADGQCRLPFLPGKVVWSWKNH